jgi:flavin reductase (DIM6/NTAB) family NADH-FMN oxidoreductase RutF
MQNFSLEDIQSWDRFYRGNFINSLSGAKTATLIGTANENGISNLGLFSNLVHIGSDPALIGYINRPRAAAPHTIANIESTGEYTINHVTASLIHQAHQASAKYPEDSNEFQEVGLTEELFSFCKAPFVKESKLKYAMRLEEIIPITRNNTFLVIGSLQRILIDEVFLTADGYLPLDELQSLSTNGIDAYYRISRITRLKYAKPGQPTAEIHE